MLQDHVSVVAGRRLLNDERLFAASDRFKVLVEQKREAIDRESEVYRVCNANRLVTPAALIVTERDRDLYLSLDVGQPIEANALRVLREREDLSPAAKARVDELGLAFDEHRAAEKANARAHGYEPTRRDIASATREIEALLTEVAEISADTPAGAAAKATIMLTARMNNGYEADPEERVIHSLVSDLAIMGVGIERIGPAYRGDHIAADAAAEWFRLNTELNSYDDDHERDSRIVKRQSDAENTMCSIVSHSLTGLCAKASVLAALLANPADELHEVYADDIGSMAWSLADDLRRMVPMPRETPVFLQAAE